MDVTLRNYTPADKSDFIDLHHRVFGTWSSVEASEVFTWKYELAPFSNDIPVFVAETEGEIVSARGEVFLPVMIGGSEELVMQGSDVMTHPDFRGNGIYSRLRQHIHGYYSGESIERPVMDFGFPEVAARNVSLNQGSFAIDKREFHRVMSPSLTGRADEGILTRLGHVALGLYGAVRERGLGPDDASAVSVELAEQVPISDLVKLYQRAIPSTIHVKRSRKFYEWRVRDPLNTFRAVLAREGGNPIAGLVYSTSVDGKVKIRDVLPLDWSNLDRTVFFKLLHRVLTECRETTSVTIWDKTMPQSVISSAGFLPESSIPFKADSLCITFTPLGSSNDPRINGVDLTEPSNWQMSAITQDQ